MDKIFEEFRNGKTVRMGVPSYKPFMDEMARTGANVTICPSVTIGENSVIGAGSVVTKDIPDNAVAVGNPARVIKTIDMETGETKRV